MDRLPCLTEGEKENILEIIDELNTKKSTNTAVKLFKSYLLSRVSSADFEHISKCELDNKLTSFYLEMRNDKGELYKKKSTLTAYRHGIQRFLEKQHPRDNIDIVKGNEFKRSITAFMCMTKELKSKGKATVPHHPFIYDEDLDKVYRYLTDGTSRSRHYKCRDELTKNHQDDSERSSDGRMYEIKESIICPVRSFVKYVRRWNPKCASLFQKPIQEPENGVYYCDVPLGHSTVGCMMQEISKAVNLSQIYTNHSCRATTVHVLDAANVPRRHIMTVTGHKAETSLKTYSGKTDDRTKKMMSTIISTMTENSSFGISDIVAADLLPLTDSQNDELLNELMNDNDGFDDTLQNIDVQPSGDGNSGSCNSNICAGFVPTISYPSFQ